MTAVALAVYSGRRVFHCLLWKPRLLAADYVSSAVGCFASTAVACGLSCWLWQQHLLLFAIAVVAFGLYTVVAVILVICYCNSALGFQQILKLNLN
jgi:hypothetical protein